MTKHPSGLMLRVPDPFDGSAEARLSHMGLLNQKGQLFIFVPPGGAPPLPTFLSSLDKKLRAKLSALLALLVSTPLGLLREPHVKHFTIEKYNALYELRAKGKSLVRITFTVLPNGDILLLTPFVKKHTRNTMQALDTSLKMLSQIDDGTGSYRELTINNFTEVRT